MRRDTGLHTEFLLFWCPKNWHCFHIRCLFTCPPSTSEEKIQYLQTLGAEVIRCPAVPTSGGYCHFQSTWGNTLLTSFLLLRSWPLSKRCQTNGQGARWKLLPLLSNWVINTSDGDQICLSLKGGLFVNQFNNLNNTEAHYRTTGPGPLVRWIEIWSFSISNIDASIVTQKSGEILMAR